MAEISTMMKTDKVIFSKQGIGNAFYGFAANTSDRTLEVSDRQQVCSRLEYSLSRYTEIWILAVNLGITQRLE